MRIGVHPNNLHLRLASLWPGAFEALDPVFVPYQEGRDTGLLLDAGVIDLGGTGSTPAVTAAALGLDVVYVAGSAPRPANGGIFTRAGSGIASIQDLKASRIALLDGSFHTYLLARALEDEGLSLRDVTMVEPRNADVLPMLADGRIDAWVAMSPRLERAEADPSLHLLVRCGALIPNRSVFWTQEGRLSETQREAVAAELDRIGRAVNGDPAFAARRLVDSGATEADAAEWERILSTRDFSVEPAGTAILSEQREEAETLARHAYRPGSVLQAMEATG
jgi:sulfonate transport system substrate-binding protein